MASSKPCWPRSRSPGDEGAEPVARPGLPMALTGRAGLAALVGALVVLAFRTTAVLLAVNGVLVAAITVACCSTADVHRSFEVKIPGAAMKGMPLVTTRKP